MKKPAIAVLFSLLFISLLTAQTRVVPPPAIAYGVNADTLSENITIRVQGKVSQDMDVDVSLTGAGSQFEASQLIDGKKTRLGCAYTVSQTESDYVVTYSISAVELSNSEESQTRGEAVAKVFGKARCQLGQPVTILRGEESWLTLTVLAAAEPDAAPDSASPRR